MNIMRKSFIIIALAFLSAGCSSVLRPQDLMCEYQSDPQAVDETSPRLSWVNIQEGRTHGNDQTAWQIQVASSREGLESGSDVWDSGKVSGPSAPFVNYAGNLLKSATRYWWRVRVWDSKDKVSRWSPVAQWVSGYLDPSEWTAEWIGAPWDIENPRDWRDGYPIYDLIGNDTKVAVVQAASPSTPAPLIRKKFTVNKEVLDAHLFISGLGYCEPYFNGAKVGDDLLSPNQTDYGERKDMDRRRLPLILNSRAHSVFYLGYDLTSSIRQGENVVGCVLGNGFFNSAHIWTAGYGSPRVKAQLEISYKDGSRETISTDETWKVRESAIRSNDVFGGEVYDARFETPGWSSPDVDDSLWPSAVQRNAPGGALHAQMGPHDKVIETFKPVGIEKIADKTYKITFPEEISGRMRLSNIQGAAGDTLKIQYICDFAHDYNYNGISEYVCSGKGSESYAPVFDWYVFHSAIVENWEGDMAAEDVLAEAISTDVPVNSSFHTSDTLINAISKIWVRTQKNNMHGSVPSDCPHRERGPYTGDGEITSAMVMHNFDARSFYNKWIKDIFNSQDIISGYVPNSAPWEPGCAGGPGWGAAMTIIPWEYYLAYGDRQLLAEHYEAIKMETDFLASFATPEGTIRTEVCDDSFLMNLGEHAAPFTTPSQEMVHTYVAWTCADYTSRIAHVLGETADAEAYKALADKIAAAFHAKFYDPKEGTYGPDECDVMALRIGVPETERERVINDFKKRIGERGNHIVTGLIASRVFFEVLADCGLSDLAWEILRKDDFPSFGKMIKEGATTMWEQFDAKYSHDHPMFGGSLVWFYRYLAGLKIDPENPAYKHSIISPFLAEGLDSVDYTLDTVYGPIHVGWKRSGSRLSMDITVPEGCSATLKWPVEGETFSGSGIKAKGTAELVSGTYRLSSK